MPVERKAWQAAVLVKFDRRVRGQRLLNVSAKFGDGCADHLYARIRLVIPLKHAIQSGLQSIAGPAPVLVQVDKDELKGRLASANTTDSSHIVVPLRFEPVWCSPGPRLFETSALLPNFSTYLIFALLNEGIEHSLIF